MMKGSELESHSQKGENTHLEILQHASKSFIISEDNMLEIFNTWTE